MFLFAYFSWAYKVFQPFGSRVENDDLVYTMGEFQLTQLLLLQTK
jgi:hypothetical protein